MLVLRNLRDDGAVALTHAVGTPRRQAGLLAVATGFHQVSIPDQAVALPDVEHHIREGQLVLVVLADALGIDLGDDREPQAEFGDLDRGRDDINSINVLDHRLFV